MTVTRRQWSPHSHGLTMEVDLCCHTCNTMAILPKWCTDYTCHHSRTHWTCCKGWSLEWAVRLTHSHVVSSATTTSVDLLPWACRNLWADRLANTIDITSSMQLGKAEVLSGLGNFLNMDRPEHDSIDRLKERGTVKGSGRHSTFLAWSDLCSTRQTLALFRGQPWAWGDCWEAGQSAYGPLRALRCHIELKLKLQLTQWSKQSWKCVSFCFVRTKHIQNSVVLRLLAKVSLWICRIFSLSETMFTAYF